MSHPLVFLLAAALFAIVFVRCVCVIYNLYLKDHPNGFLGFSGFGYSYIALVAGAACVLAWLATGQLVYVKAAAWLFLCASAGMIIFDRRPRSKWPTVTPPAS